MTPEWIPAAQAMANLGVNDRTLRKWAVKGKLRRRRDEEGRACYHAEDVARLAGENRSPSADEVTMPEMQPPTAEPVPAKRRGRPRRAAQVPEATAAPVPDPARQMAERLADARARERELRQEIQWLRARLDHMQEAERDFRQLLLHNSRALDTIATQIALPEHPGENSVSAQADGSRVSFPSRPSSRRRAT
jgi:DNA-binding transcriptional MerR regulator